MTRCLLILICLALMGSFAQTARAARLTLAQNSRPKASIVVADSPDRAAAFAALELQFHLRLMTGAVFPLVSESKAPTGPRILVGESAATRALGLAASRFQPQEYLIRIAGDTLVLLGRDRPDPVSIPELPPLDDAGLLAAVRPPETFDAQASLYAVYDFLERYGGVRWYAPGEIGRAVPARKTFAVGEGEIRRSPAFRFRQGNYLPVYGMLKAVWDDPSPEAVRLYARRMRLGGEPYAANHSFYGYYDRFWHPNAEAPERFESAHPEWFAQGYPGQPPQMCFTDPGFRQQAAQDARDFFDGKGAKPGAQAEGDFFALVPMDNSDWCRCERCQVALNQAERSNPHFSNGWTSDYIFGFANAVAREIRASHPGKYLATLAYSSYAYYPERLRLESNIAVQLCLHVRNWWAPSMEQNDTRFYRSWTQKEKDRPIYLWLYLTFPEEIAMNGGWRCFPGFFAHTLHRQFAMFAQDKIRGAFLNNLGDHLDTYLTFRFLDDPSQDVDRLIDEFHRLYYGPAAAPMKRLYLTIESIFSDPANYPESVRSAKGHQHQTEEMAWRYLGTAERMAALGKLMARARSLARTDLQKRRVALFARGIWDPMVEGRRLWLAKQPPSSAGERTAP
ncbi:MAG: DUF4838 domain-containing protein [Armatimonadetes bacterium]|nr:DUF4838 domain-containing protein [Armatimonadota bacterium]